MNPSQRLFLQTVWEAIEDSGYSRDMIAGTETGVYVGYSNDNDGHKYMGMIYDVEGEYNQMGIPGNMGSVIQVEFLTILT
jgi:polyketide synthase PksN/surfactin family lipopeptide synthetase A